MSGYHANHYPVAVCVRAEMSDESPLVGCNYGHLALAQMIV